MMRTRTRNPSHQSKSWISLSLVRPSAMPPIRHRLSPVVDLAVTEADVVDDGEVLLEVKMVCLYM